MISQKAAAGSAADCQRDHVLQGNLTAKGAQVQPVSDTDTAQPPAAGARTILTLGTAMSLYGLTASDSLWELQQDTRCLVSWGGRHVVVAFRGTASMKNALADLQASLSACLLPISADHNFWPVLALRHWASQERR